MIIRDYIESDESEWLKCRVVSLLDTSYYNDVSTRRDEYENDAICLVAEQDGKIIGLIDVEVEQIKGSLCVEGDCIGAVIWHLAVLPEYRRKGVATLLWNEAQKRLLSKNILYCEVWTQEDEPANNWYLSKGFENIKDRNWLRCYARASQVDWFLNKENVGEIYGVEEMIFEVSTNRRNEVSEYCHRIDEVRLYSKQLKM